MMCISIRSRDIFPLKAAFLGQITYNSPPEPELQINAGNAGAW
jgi:hypothetical protein